MVEQLFTLSTGETQLLVHLLAVLAEGETADTEETLQTVQPTAEVELGPAVALRDIRLILELDELVVQELSMYDTPYKKLAPGIHLYNLGSLVEEFDNSVLSKYKYNRGVILDVKNGTNRYSRITGIASLDKTHSDMPEEDSVLVEALKRIEDEIVQEYARIYEIGDLKPLHNWLLMQYIKGDYFKVHKDELPDIVRTVSAIVCLNDSYEGGEIEFPDFDVLLKLKPWDVLIFPSAFSYRHGVLPISDGVRYSAVNWYTYGSVS